MTITSRKAPSTPNKESEEPPRTMASFDSVQKTLPVMISSVMLQVTMRRVIDMRASRLTIERGYTNLRLMYTFLRFCSRSMRLSMYLLMGKL